jgi:hypothetical protein
VPQLIPAGELVTVPEPAPDFETVSVKLVGGGVDDAVVVNARPIRSSTLGEDEG